MSATIDHTPNFMLRRLVAVALVAVVVVGVLVATVHAGSPTVHVQFLKGHVQQVSGYSGGVPLETTATGH